MGRGFGRTLDHGPERRSQELRGFARVVRDFSTRHRIDEALLHKRGAATRRPESPSPASSRASSTALSTPTTRFSACSDTAARI
jgi:hypothetical protein